MKPRFLIPAVILIVAAFFVASFAAPDSRGMGVPADACSNLYDGKLTNYAINGIPGAQNQTYTFTIPAQEGTPVYNLTETYSVPAHSENGTTAPGNIWYDDAINGFPQTGCLQVVAGSSLTVGGPVTPPSAVYSGHVFDQVVTLTTGNINLTTLSTIRYNIVWVEPSNGTTTILPSTTSTITIHNTTDFSAPSSTTASSTTETSTHVSTVSTASATNPTTTAAESSIQMSVSTTSSQQPISTTTEASTSEPSTTFLSSSQSPSSSSGSASSTSQPSASSEASTSGSSAATLTTTSTHSSNSSESTVTTSATQTTSHQSSTTERITTKTLTTVVNDTSTVETAVSTATDNTTKAAASGFTATDVAYVGAAAVILGAIGIGTYGVIRKRKPTT